MIYPCQLIRLHVQAAAMIKTMRSGTSKADLRPMIDNYISYMGFDPAFYCYRPVYGPTLMAGAEIYRMLKEHPLVMNDRAVQMNK
jgi:hypothetical protein